MAKLTRSRLLRRFILGVLSFACVLTFAACTGTAPNSDSPNASSGGGSQGATTLNVATEPAFPPFESQAANGGFEGFDIDLMNAIGQAEGFTVNFQSLPFDGIIPALQAGTVDAAISSMTITKERSQTVDFSRPYFKAGLAIAVQNNNNTIKSFDDLKGKRIAVQIGTTGAATASKVEDVQVRTFDSAPLALQELANGNVDAVINDAPVTLYAIEQGNIGRVKVVGQQLTEEYYGIALPKGSPNQEKVNAGLATIIENGTYDQIYKKWFGENQQPPQLPETAPI